MIFLNVYHLLHNNLSFQDRLPFLDTGIVEILARATNGVGIVLEHRYYGMYTIFQYRLFNLSFHTGESLPVSNLSTDSLRYDFNVFSPNRRLKF